ncbi:MAG: amidohydrolase family protein [Planctomycetota bacterium]
MRIDAHQHFWSYDPVEYAWIGAGMESLRRDFLPDDLAPLLDQRQLDGSIAVQARQSLEETRWLLSLARESERVRGVVGWVDLRSPDVAAELDRLADEPALVGLRHVVQDEPDDEFLLRDDFQRGVAALAGRGLIYDVLIYPRQLPAAVRFVERFPDQPFVLDHLAKPLIRDGAMEPWASLVAELARSPNVSCKVSGLVTEAHWRAWTPEELVPYLDVALEAFGPERLLYGSDWPVCLLASGYGRMFAATEDWAERRLSAQERVALFGGNAARVYGLR